MTTAHANDNLVCEQWCDIGVNGGKWWWQWWTHYLWKDCCHSFGHTSPLMKVPLSLKQESQHFSNLSPLNFSKSIWSLWQTLEQLAFCGEGRKSSYGDKYDAIILSGHMALAAHALSALKPHPGDAGFFVEINCYQTCNVWSNLIALSWVLHLKVSFIIDDFYLDRSYHDNTLGKQ